MHLEEVSSLGTAVTVPNEPQGCDSEESRCALEVVHRYVWHLRVTTPLAEVGQYRIEIELDQHVHAVAPLVVVDAGERLVEHDEPRRLVTCGRVVTGHCREQRKVCELGLLAPGPHRLRSRGEL